MPRIRQLTVTQQLANLSPIANLQSVTPQEYIILYALAARHTSEPRKLVRILRQIPDAILCAQSASLSRTRGDRDQSVEMHRQLKEIITEILSTVKLPPR